MGMKGPKAYPNAIKAILGRYEMGIKTSRKNTGTVPYKRMMGGVPMKRMMGDMPMKKMKKYY